MEKHTETRYDLRELLVRHYRAHPELEISDAFKFLYQSAFGCEHLLSSGERALDGILSEHSASPADSVGSVEPLGEKYSRVSLSVLDSGLSASTLAELFRLSAKREEGGLASLESGLRYLVELTHTGDLPFDTHELEEKIEKWKEDGYPSLHHSDTFRRIYRPSYRVISNRFVKFLPLFKLIDERLCSGRVILAVEGGAASGKSTLGEILHEVYGCTIFHADDFFLRPEQRTEKRLAEVGGNIDRERLFDEIIRPLSAGESVTYRPFLCSSMTLGERVTVEPTPLSVVEGAYSMHPSFGEYYTLSVFMDIDDDLQRKRILKRNPNMAERFLGEWIPRERAYFDKMRIKERAALVIPAE